MTRTIRIDFSGIRHSFPKFGGGSHDVADLVSDAWESLHYIESVCDVKFVRADGNGHAKLWTSNNGYNYRGFADWDNNWAVLVTKNEAGKKFLTNTQDSTKIWTHEVAHLMGQGHDPTEGCCNMRWDTPGCAYRFCSYTINNLVKKYGSSKVREPFFFSFEESPQPDPPTPPQPEPEPPAPPEEPEEPPMCGNCLPMEYRILIKKKRIKIFQKVQDQNEQLKKRIKLKDDEYFKVNDLRGGKKNKYNRPDDEIQIRLKDDAIILKWDRGADKSYPLREIDTVTIEDVR